MRRKQRAFLLALGILALTGCAFAMKLLEHRHGQVNDTIREARNAQSPVNIVRVRDEGSPNFLYFLPVPSAPTSASVQASVGAAGAFPVREPNVFDASGGLSYAESPIVTWSLPVWREHLGRLLAPMGADQLTAMGMLCPFCSKKIVGGV